MAKYGSKITREKFHFVHFNPFYIKKQKNGHKVAVNWLKDGAKTGLKRA